MFLARVRSFGMGNLGCWCWWWLALPRLSVGSVSFYESQVPVTDYSGGSLGIFQLLAWLFALVGKVDCLLIIWGRRYLQNKVRPSTGTLPTSCDLESHGCRLHHQNGRSLSREGGPRRAISRPPLLTLLTTPGRLSIRSTRGEANRNRSPYKPPRGMATTLSTKEACRACPQYKKPCRPGTLHVGELFSLA